MLDKYNVMLIYSDDTEKYVDFFKAHNIPKVDSIATAWDTFSKEHGGISEKYILDGKDVYSIPEIFKDWGIYRAERREE